MILIPAGKYYISASEDGYTQYPEEDSAGYYKTKQFYLCDHEVSNGEYLIFLQEFFKADTNQYKKMLPDTLSWRNKSIGYDPMTIYYLRHPIYNTYPVVGISYEQALEYCTWLTKKYITEGERKYKNVIFRLPERKEWVYAAKGGLSLYSFPWKGTSLKNQKGEWLANFRFFSQGNIYKIPGKKNDHSSNQENQYLILGKGEPTGHYLTGKNDDLTVPVMSYKPNGYGLHNMAGNVEEYVIEKGSTKGGSWDDPGFYLINTVHKIYTSQSSASCTIGFRVAMEIIP